MRPRADDLLHEMNGVNVMLVTAAKDLQLFVALPFRFGEWRCAEQTANYGLRAISLSVTSGNLDERLALKERIARPSLASLTIARSGGGCLIIYEGRTTPRIAVSSDSRDR
jgi:hypothetical protein